MPTSPSRTLTVSIARTPAEVYRFVADPANLPRWTTAFCKFVRRVGDDWIITTSVGPAGEPPTELKIRFADPNALGVLDHNVTVAPGVIIHVPMRVVPNHDGSEVMLTLTCLPDMTAADFERDAGMITRDLQTLKRVLEAREH